MEESNKTTLQSQTGRELLKVLTEAELALKEIKAKMDAEPTIPKRISVAFNLFYEKEMQLLQQSKSAQPNTES